MLQSESGKMSLPLPFLSVWSRAILSDRSFLSLDDVRIQPREAPFDLTMKVGVE